MELLVVIGIITVLIGILLPVINKSRQASVTLKCQAQLRQMYHGLSMYAVDNKGRLPWGQYQIDITPGSLTYTHGQSRGGTQNLVTWQTIINQYFNPTEPNTLFVPGTGDLTIGDTPGSNLFLCPGVWGASAKSSYACNLVAMPDKDYEEEWVKYNGTRQPVLQPAQIGKLFPHNILLFDTGASVNSDAMFVVGYDVDKHYFSDPGDTMARFFRGDDPYTGNRDRGQGIAINTETDQNRDWVDPGNGLSPNYPYQGNIRYRHSGDKLANFLFADGHVESLRPDQVIRYMFKLRWPTGMPVSTGSWDEHDEE